ncbi:PTS lactose/cellobiose transporter subunit IIA [Bacillus licheniformis]|nr:PTS lactose/cellobiose transporter subunit IIA [Bacillus licheniformis]
MVNRSVYRKGAKCPRNWNKRYFKLSFTEETAGALHGSDSRSQKGDFAAAKEKIRAADEELIRAHHFQTALIQMKRRVRNRTFTAHDSCPGSFNECDDHERFGRGDCRAL